MPKDAIEKIEVRKILDSRGGLTVEVSLSSKKKSAKAMIPNSTSTGAHEVFAFPEGDVDLAISNFGKVKGKLIGIGASEQRTIDSTLHEIGGERFGIIGGNVATGVSIAAAKLAAATEEMELYNYIHGSFMKKLGVKKKMPRPLGNLIGGGTHSKNKMSIQEILISPKGISFAKSISINASVHKALGEHLNRKLNISTGVNVEGAWVTGLGDEENLALATEMAGLAEERGVDVQIGADFAASEYFRNGKYEYQDRKLSPSENVEFIETLVNEFGMAVVEDPMNEDDYRGFSEITKRIGKGSLVVGDDLYTTNIERLQEGIRNKSTNGILIKVNQIGTLSDTMDVIGLAHKNGIKTVVSHRSRETTDDFIAHLAVAFGSEFIKTGIVGGERIAKLNELARIEEIES